MMTIIIICVRCDHHNLCTMGSSWRQSSSIVYDAIIIMIMMIIIHIRCKHHHDDNHHYLCTMRSSWWQSSSSVYDAIIIIRVRCNYVAQGMSCLFFTNTCKLTRREGMQLVTNWRTLSRVAPLVGWTAPLTISNIWNVKFLGSELIILFRTFVLFSSPLYGNCFLFNSRALNVNAMSTALPGPGYGFSLVLDIERGQYAGITDSEGIRWVWMVQTF